MRTATTFETMGTVVSVRGIADIRPAVDVFEKYNARFSLYRESSELSHIARGELMLSDASATLRDMYTRALDWRARTAGAFTPHRPDGVIDLNGIVKACAIADAAALATGNFSINCGGDMQVGGDQTVGISSPDDPGALLAAVTIAGRYRAIATSGSAQRGDHIWGRSTEFRQVSVIGGDIVTADVLATAIIAGGHETLELATREFDVQVLAVRSTTGDGNSELVASPGFRHLLART